MRERIRGAREYISSSGLGPFLVRSVAGTGAVRVASMMASFGVGVQLARGLGLEGYGLYGIALSVITLAGIPGELGLAKLVTREVSIAAGRNDVPSLLGVLRWADRACWALSAVMTVGVIITGLVLIHRGSSPVGLALVLGSPVIPLLALSRIRGGALQGLHHITLGQIPANLLRPLLLSLLLFLIYFAGLSMTPASVMALNALTAAAILFITQQWLRTRLPPGSQAKTVQTGTKWLASSIPLALNDGMRTLQSELTILIIGMLLVAADAGLLRISLSTAAIAAAPMTVLARVNLPTIARLHAQNDARRLQKLVTYSAYAQTVGVLALSLPLLLVPELLLSFVFGDEFAPAGNALRIIAVGQIANAAFGPNGMLLNMTHNERRVTRAMSIALVLNVGTVFFLATPFGIVGAAIGYVFSLLLWNVLTWLDGRLILAIDTSILGGLIPIRR